MSRVIIVMIVLSSGFDIYAQDMPLSSFTVADEPFRKVENPGEMPGPKTNTEPREESQLRPEATVFTKDGGTVFSTNPDGKAIWAYVFTKDSELKFGEPYCPLRLKKGQDMTTVYGLILDDVGRIYAATEEGIQVFDRTGRLCGVLLLPKRGIPLYMQFEGEKLTLWLDDAKYAKKMNAQGQ